MVQDNAHPAKLPPALRERFNADGTPLPFAGNTVICHVERQSPLMAALKEIQAQGSHWSFGRKITLLPAVSYHMTVFGGAKDKHRRVPGGWPQGMRVGASMEDCNTEMRKRLEAADFGNYSPLRMRVSPVDVQDTDYSLRLELEPADEIEDRKLRKIRAVLADIMGMRSEGHDRFRFHITVGYLLGWLNHGEMSDYRTSYQQCRDLIAERVPRIEFRQMEFCAFDNMLHFERRLLIGSKS